MRERERDIQTERDGSDVTLAAMNLAMTFAPFPAKTLKLATNFAPFLAKNFHLSIGEEFCTFLAKTLHRSFSPLKGR